jgi:hypothetical protein
MHCSVSQVLRTETDYRRCCCCASCHSCTSSSLPASFAIVVHAWSSMTVRQGLVTVLPLLHATATSTVGMTTATGTETMTTRVAGCLAGHRWRPQHCPPWLPPPCCPDSYLGACHADADAGFRDDRNSWADRLFRSGSRAPAGDRSTDDRQRDDERRRDDDPPPPRRPR